MAGQEITNFGEIHLDSANSNYRSDIATGASTLTNLGTISSSFGTGVEFVQTVDAKLLGNGIHYLKVRAFLHRTDVAKGNLGLLGFSLGGHVVLLAGKTPSVVVPKAVVEFAGPTTDLGGNLNKLPPLQIHHGEKDIILVPSNTRNLITQMKGITPAPDVHWYKDEGHVPFTPGGTTASLSLTIAFFSKYLR